MLWSNTRSTLCGEALLALLLARERLHDADARDALLGLGGQLADPLLHLLQRRPGVAPVARRGEDDERHRRERDRASDGCRTNITAAASRIVSRFWRMKISP